jgi:hypothetical protein
LAVVRLYQLRLLDKLNSVSVEVIN